MPPVFSPSSRRRLLLALLGLPLAMPRAATAAGFVYRPIGLRLYQSDEVLRDRVPGGPSRLGSYVHEISHALREALTAETAGAGFSGALVVMLRPGAQARHWLVAPTPLATVEQRVRQALSSRPSPPVQNGALAFAVRFDAWGGGAAPALADGELPTPEEWKAALGGPARYPMQDADLVKVWPPDRHIAAPAGGR